MADMQPDAGDRLVSFIEEIEKFEDDKAALSVDIKGVYDAAKGEGFDPKVMRKVIMLRRKTESEVDEERTTLEIYMEAVGFGEGDPLAGDMRGENGEAKWVSPHAHTSGTA